MYELDSRRRLNSTLNCNVDIYDGQKMCATMLVTYSFDIPVTVLFLYDLKLPHFTSTFTNEISLRALIM